MRHRILFLALTTFVIALNSHASFQERAHTADKPLYHVTGNEASVFGTITVSGKLPPAKKIDMSSDPPCQQVNQKRTAESLLTNGDKLVNAFVYIREGDALNTYRFEIPEAEVVLQHKKCQFSPRVLGVRAGQRLSIVNADPTFHNTHPSPKSNVEWNQSQPAGFDPIVKTFVRPELLIPVRDNMHPWEKAYVSVMDHPFFAVTDEQGNYEIRGLPPGKYMLVMWHEVLGEQEIELTLQPNENRQLDVLFNGEKALQATKPGAYPWE